MADDTTKIATENLQKLLKDDDSQTLLDVLPEWSYQQEHLPGAVNACVYEATFQDKARELIPEKNRRIVVYGTSRNSHASAFAAEKLVLEGYTNVLDYTEGLEGWRRSGGEIVSSEQEAEDPSANLTEFPPQTERRGFAPQDCVVKWEGRNLAGRHNGTIAVKSGYLEISDGQISSGEVLIDMSTIQCLDIADAQMNQVLVDHLESHDFFDVKRYPMARYVITGGQQIQGATPGAPNLRIEGQLTLKDVTRDLLIRATAGVTAEGDWVAQANFEIDRTRWNVIYGSGRLFQRLGMHLVSDQILLGLKVVCPVTARQE
jgi:rhodanese-related sulfurtransferase/polyisoprenoid-binding protein YceI